MSRKMKISVSIEDWNSEAGEVAGVDREEVCFKRGALRSISRSATPLLSQLIFGAGAFSVYTLMKKPDESSKIDLLIAGAL